MPIEITEVTVKNVLTRTTGYLRTVSTHSLQPYRGCTLGNSLCGVGCYVRHNGHVLRGREWGGFLEVRTNAADSYREYAPRERRWAHKREERFSIFLSSSTEPFLPQEKRFGVTRGVLEAMLDEPPDLLILQTHTDRAPDHLDLLVDLAERCELRIHVSIETDRDGIPGLPGHAVSVERRLQACAKLKQAGLHVVVTVSPLLPIDEPQRFFSRIADVADAVVLDHFIAGDGSADGSRTFRTPLPAAIAALGPEFNTLAYRDAMVAVAREILPGRVGVNIDGFAGRYLDASIVADG